MTTVSQPCAARISSRSPAGVVNLAAHDHPSTSTTPARRSLADVAGRRASIRRVLPRAIPEPQLKIDTEHDRALGAQVIGLLNAGLWRIPYQPPRAVTELCATCTRS
jgi:hypothetical protein